MSTSAGPHLRQSLFLRSRPFFFFLNHQLPKLSPCTYSMSKVVSRDTSHGMWEWPVALVWLPDFVARLVRQVRWFHPMTLSLTVLVDSDSCGVGPGLGIECSLARPHSSIISWTWYWMPSGTTTSPVISWTWYWMPSGTTTRSCFQLDMVLNALRGTTTRSCYQLDLVINALCHCHTVLYVISWTWYWMLPGTTAQSCYQLDLVLNAQVRAVEMGIDMILNALRQYHTDLLLGAWAWYHTPHRSVIKWAWYWIPSNTTTECFYQLGLVILGNTGQSYYQLNLEYNFWHYHI